MCEKKEEGGKNISKIGGRKEIRNEGEKKREGKKSKKSNQFYFKFFF